MANMIPSTHTRSVFTGISGSSIFDTADRTSGYGESSSTSFVSNSVNSDYGRREGAYQILSGPCRDLGHQTRCSARRQTPYLCRIRTISGKKERFSSLNV